MWISYFRNLDNNSCFFQYSRNFINPEFSNNKKSYNISSVYFDEKEFKPLKIYQLNDEEVICYVVEEADAIEDLSNISKDLLGKTKSTVLLKFAYDAQEEKDELYFEKRLPSCDSSSYQAARELAYNLNALGISVVNYCPKLNNKFCFTIESNNPVDAHANTELVRFFATSIFRSVYGKFLLARNNEKDSFKVKISLFKELEKNQQKKLDKNMSLSPGFVDLSYEKSDLCYREVSKRVISILSP